MSEQTHDILSTGEAALAELAPILPGRVNVAKLQDAPGLRVRTLAFDDGAVLAEHVAGVPVLIHVVVGRVLLRIADTEHELAAGALVRADAETPHSVTAVGPARLILTLLG